MKNLIKISIVILSIFFAQNTNAQFTPGEYKKDNKINKFVGTWQWQSGDSIFTISLKKEKVNLKKITNGNIDIKADLLIGWHEYSVDGKVIESRMKHKKTLYYDKKHTIHILRSDDTYFKMSFRDLSKSKDGHAKLELLPGKTDEARWTLKNSPGIHIVTKENPRKPGFTVPTELIMKKIK